MDPRNAKQAARELLEQAVHDPKKLALFYAGASVIFSLVCSVLSYALSIAADDATGLSGLATRSLLESGQFVVSLASTFLLTFWQMGLIATALSYAKREHVDYQTLMGGFRRWGAVIRLSLMLLIVVIGVTMLCSYIATFVFTISPFSDKFAEKLLSFTDSSGNITASPEVIASQLLPHMGWLVVIFLVVMLVVALPFLYKYRMSEFALMDGAPGAFAAIRESKQLAQYNRMGMFKLDLSFWWFYLLMILAGAVGYADVLLPELGVKLPINADLVFWISYILSLGLQFLITWQFAFRYQTAFAVYYNRLKEDAQRPIISDIPPYVS